MSWLSAVGSTIIQKIGDSILGYLLVAVVLAALQWVVRWLSITTGIEGFLFCMANVLFFVIYVLWGFFVLGYDLFTEGRNNNVSLTALCLAVSFELFLWIMWSDAAPALLHM